MDVFMINLLWHFKFHFTTVQSRIPSINHSTESTIANVLRAINCVKRCVAYPLSRDKNAHFFGCNIQEKTIRNGRGQNKCLVTRSVQRARRIQIVRIGLTRRIIHVPNRRDRI